jgi:hypothetical protein
VAYATSMETIGRGLDRLRAALQKLG